MSDYITDVFNKKREEAERALAWSCDESLRDAILTMAHMFEAEVKNSVDDSDFNALCPNSISVDGDTVRVRYMFVYGDYDWLMSQPGASINSQFQVSYTHYVEEEFKDKKIVFEMEVLKRLTEGDKQILIDIGVAKRNQGYESWSISCDI